MPLTPSRPPRPDNPEGRPRSVGVEIEFAGPGCAETAGMVRHRFGGTIEITDPHRFEIRGTAFGDVTVELDMMLAHPKGGEGVIGGAVRDALGRIGSLVLPYELSLAPLPIDRLVEVDDLTAELRRLGAQGTEGALVYAFGLHLNPEIATTDTGWLTRCLKAFLILEPWLRVSIGIDPARRIAPFIEHFPAAYRNRLADPGYRPDLGTLIEDYVAANPTRNRGLDMFPLFARLDPERFFRLVDDPHVKARPTFHYRLPNSRVGDPGWSILPDWDRWLAVERLAEDPDRLDAMGIDWLDRFRNAPARGWVEETERWLAR